MGAVVVSGSLPLLFFKLGGKMKIDKEKIIDNLAMENFQLKSNLGLMTSNFERLLFLIEENIQVQKKVLIILEKIVKK